MQGLSVTKSSFTDEQIKEILRAVRGQNTIQTVCRQQGISRSTFYRWRAKARAHEHALQGKRLREHEMENGQLKRQVSELLLDFNALRVALVKEVSSAC